MRRRVSGRLATVLVAAGVAGGQIVGAAPVSAEPGPVAPAPPVPIDPFANSAVPPAASAPAPAMPFSPPVAGQLVAQPQPLPESTPAGQNPTPKSGNPSSLPHRSTRSTARWWGLPSRSSSTFSGRLSTVPWPSRQSLGGMRLIAKVAAAVRTANAVSATLKANAWSLTAFIGSAPTAAASHTNSLSPGNQRHALSDETGHQPLGSPVRNLLAHSWHTGGFENRSESRLQASEMHLWRWARRVSNPRPLVCKTRALPLSYTPVLGGGYTATRRHRKSPQLAGRAASASVHTARSRSSPGCFISANAMTPDASTTNVPRFG